MSCIKPKWMDEEWMHGRYIFKSKLWILKIKYLLLKKKKKRPNDLENEKEKKTLWVPLKILIKCEEIIIIDLIRALLLSVDSDPI